MEDTLFHVHLSAQNTHSKHYYKMLKEEQYSSPTGAALNSIQNTRKNNKNKNKNNKRRFSDEQIRSLETMFETETNLEPRKKMLLAKELGLQPRQVAIWFQNKRARWKSKQLEQEYNRLQSNFDGLATCFEALKKEKQALTLQLQKLKDSIEKPREGRECCSRNGLEENCNDGEVEVIPSLSLDRIGIENGVNVLSDEDSSMKTEYFGIEEEEHSLLNMVEPADGSLTSSDNWASFETDGLFDESSNSYLWWDFWS